MQTCAAGGGVALLTTAG
ncbi:hypothetical protein KQ305_10025 [Synechococcus sp. CS-1332]|nr:hypothetical protein [Synechococcus sp. CS-1332]